MSIMGERGNPVLKGGFFFFKNAYSTLDYILDDMVQFKQTKTVLLRILMKNVFIFHCMGSTNLMKYLK